MIQKSAATRVALQQSSTPHSGQTRTRFFSLAAALLIALGAIAGCAETSSTNANARATTTPAATATATFPPTVEGRLAQRVSHAVGLAAQRVEVAYHAGNDDAVVTITLVWSPSWKLDFAQGQAAAKLACYQAQAALWTSGERLSDVTVIVLGQALDDYSEVITSAYAEADLSANHARGIVWSTLTADQAWGRYDNEFLRPTYAPNWVYVPGQR